MVTVRNAECRDETAWRALWGDYLTFYETSLSPQITDQTWARIVDPSSPLTGRLALDGDRVVGFALHHTHLSTWGLGADCYLEDLFVSEAARGLGVGRKLIEDLISICRENGHSRLYWHTALDNTRARALYDSVVASDGHVRYRIVF